MNEYIRDIMESAPEGVSIDNVKEILDSEAFTILDRTRLSSDGGMRAHRGVLAENEYVDFFELRALLEAEFGFTYEDVSAAYKTGRPTAEQRELRERIDARMLALSRAGGNMARLGQALPITEKAVYRALSRARAAEVVPMVKHGVVKSDRVCFKCGERGAQPYRRAHSDSFLRDDEGRIIEDRRGTINLCDEHHRQGLNPRPGNPAYWAFRDRLAIPEGARG